MLILSNYIIILGGLIQISQKSFIFHLTMIRRIIFFCGLCKKAEQSPLFQVYLSLYADTTIYSDSLITDIGNETRVFKL